MMAPVHPSIHWARLAVLFLAVALAFAAYRGTSCLVWDDSTCASTADGDQVEEFDARVATRRAELAADPLGTLTRMTSQAFAKADSPGGYRPVSTLYFALCFSYFYDHDRPSPWHALIVGGLYGAFAVCFLLVARRFVRREPAAWLALLLIVASPPLTATSWIFMSFVQVIMPLIMCAALLAYWGWAERGSPLALAGLLLLWLVGPWAREILFVVPVLIGYVELARARRPTWLLFLAACAFAHAVYPTALLKVLFLPELPLRSMFAMGGHVSQQMAGAPLRWHASLHFLPLVPPSLWLLSLLVSILAPVGAPPFERGTSWAAAVALSRRLLAPLVAAAAAALYWEDTAHAATAACLVIPALAWRIGAPLLAGWFLILYLPLLRVFTEHIHFLYAMVPAVVVLAMTVEALTDWLSVRRPALARLRYAVLAIALLAVADQALNLLGTYRTMHATYGGIDVVAARLRRQLRRDDILVCNTLHGEEIWYHAGYAYRNYFAIPWGVTDYTRCVADPAAFLKLLQGPGDRAVYLLDVDFDYLPAKVAHRHKYVHAYDIAKEDLGVVHETRRCYPYCDPLRCLIAREYVPFLGAPDLVNDFYCGPARDGRGFHYEVHAAYHLYRVTGSTLKPALAGPVTLIEEGVAGYNILRVGDGYVAFPQAYGGFDAGKCRQGAYGPLITGPAPAEVRRRALQSALDAPVTVAVVQEGVGGCNLLRVGQGYVAFPQAYGAFDEGKYRRGEYGELHTGGRLEEVRRKAMRAPTPAAAPRPVTLVVEGVAGFNILGVDGEFLAFPQAAGEFDLAKYRRGGYPPYLTGRTVQEAREKLLQAGASISRRRRVLLFAGLLVVVAGIGVIVARYCSFRRRCWAE